MNENNKWVNVLTGYVNKSKDGNGHYLTISNVSDEDIVLKAGGKLFLNRTPDERLKQHPNIPHYSKSVKVEDSQGRDAHVDTTSDSEVPF